MGYLLHLFCFVFLDVLGFSIILPLLPYYAAELKASPSSVGLCLTANALAQLITAPFIGKLSDTYGRRPILLACVFGTFISFTMLYYSTSIEMILLSRIVVWFFLNLLCIRSHICSYPLHSSQFLQFLTILHISALFIFNSHPLQ